MKTRTVHLLLLCLVVGILGCDHATKGLAEAELADGHAVEIVGGTVDLRYRQNYGVAFNVERHLPEGMQKPLVFLGGFLCLAFLCAAWVREAQNPSVEHVAYALILGGAVGNLLDRLMRGYVVDFVHVDGWPVFNVADVAICLGAGLLMFRATRRWHADAAT